MHTLRRLNQKLLTMAMNDTVKNSFIALPIISVFEITLIARWLISGGNDPVMYMYCYFALLTASLGMLAAMFAMRRRVDEKYRTIYILQLCYSVIITAWALGITYTGSHFSKNFDYLVYVTIVIIVPVFCFLSPLHWAPVQLVSAAIMLHMASHHPGFHGFVINFSVFTIISILASHTLYRVRYRAYQRQLELALERDQSLHHAYYDALTGLPNRRSYIEALEKLTDKNGLALAMFDVNGLKQINDGKGHSAGDELLKNAARCLEKAFEGLGSIYRVGGDEYTGIFRATDGELTKALESLRAMENENGLSVSVGIAAAEDYPKALVMELETIADDAMYKEKNEYHRKMGV